MTIVKWMLWILFGVGIGLNLYLFIGKSYTDPKPQFGITWSVTYAQFLGLDADRALDETLSELPFKHLRIPAYWNLIEPEQGRLEADWLIRQLDIVQKHQAKATVSLGARQPRWPECWQPEWTQSLSDEEREKAQIVYLENTYQRIKDHPAITGWQVENEANLRIFQPCRGLTNDLVRKEIELVRQWESTRATPRPISTTDSGELSSWTAFANQIDARGISVYRAVRQPWGGAYHYRLVPAWFYRHKQNIMKFWNKNVYVSEFQLEPWARGDIRTATQEENDETLQVDEIATRLDYAKRMGFDHVDLWGAEWWYWMKTQQGDSRYWDEVKATIW